MKSKDTAHYKELVAKLPLLKKEIAKVIIGQQDAIDEILIAFLAGGHCLLEGVPGLAKTLMVKTIAESLDMSFKRVQFTPDLMPGDIITTGTPPGVGDSMKPTTYLKKGDVVTLTIDQLGSQKHSVK